jgi:hypothetical protein
LTIALQLKLGYYVCARGKAPKASSLGCESRVSPHRFLWLAIGCHLSGFALQSFTGVKRPMLAAGLSMMFQVLVFAVE